MSGEDVLKALAPWKEVHKRPAWRPITEGRNAPLTAHKFSGTPWLAEGEDWPKCRDCGDDLQLLLQINLSDLPPEVAGDFGDGLLQLFYCTSTTGCEAEMIGWKAFEGGKVVRIVSPDGQPRGDVAIPQDQFPPKAIVGWERLEDYPSSEEREELGLWVKYDHSARRAELGWTEKHIRFEDVDFDTLESISRATSGDKLWGWPDWAQGVEYPRCPRCLRRMELVFQLESEDNLPFLFGDVGRGHVTQCPIHKEVVTFAWACS
jgi:uncharacterized protein YwqG